MTVYRAAPCQLYDRKLRGDPLYADRRNFYKVEKWSKDRQAVEAPIRQRIRVLAGM
jgi:hypothetical protein